MPHLSCLDPPPSPSEFKRWCPTLRVVRLHSVDAEERKRLVKQVGTVGAVRERPVWVRLVSLYPPFLECPCALSARFQWFRVPSPCYR